MGNILTGAQRRKLLLLPFAAQQPLLRKQRKLSFQRSYFPADDLCLGQMLISVKLIL